MSSYITGDIRDLKMKMDVAIGDLDKRLLDHMERSRDKSSELSEKINETQQTVNLVIGRFPPAYSDTGKPGRDNYILPSLKSLETEDTLPFRLDFNGDRRSWLSEDEAMIRKLSKPISSDGIHVKKDPDQTQATGSLSSKQKDEDNEDRAP